MIFKELLLIQGNTACPFLKNRKMVILKLSVAIFAKHRLGKRADPTNLLFLWVIPVENVISSYCKKRLMEKISAFILCELTDSKNIIQNY